jgi:hypothetical protein
MAITKSETQITWSAANCLSVAASGTGTSDAFTFDGASLLAMITLKCDNAGAPAAGDTVTFYLLYTTGDPDGASSDEYDSTTQGTLLGVVDTFITDPAQTTVEVCPSAKGGKIYAVNNNATRAIVVAATMYETKG